MANPDAKTLLNELETRFTQRDGKFDVLDQEVDARISYWRYAIDSAFELRADFFRRFNEQPGELLESEPIDEYIYHAYGYDAQDHIIYAAFFQTEELPRKVIFYTYLEDRVEFADYQVILYTERYELGSVGLLYQPSGQPPLYYAEFQGQRGQAHLNYETYHYDDRSRLTRIATASLSRPRPLSDEAQAGLEYGLDQQRRMAKMFGTEETWLPFFENAVNQFFKQENEHTREEIYQYEGDILKRIVDRSAPHLPVPGQSSQISERIMYEAPDENETEQSSFESARTSLYAGVIDALKQSDPTKTLQRQNYHLMLSYDAVADNGVVLFLGSEAQRIAWEQEYDEYSYRSLIMHQSMRPHQESMLDSPVLPAAYDRFIHNVRREKRWNDIRELMNRVARDLNDQNWFGILNITEDFIVFANDYEAVEDPHEEIIACVPEEKVQLLRDKGLLDDDLYDD